MNERTDKEALLADVLAEESRAGFSAALLGETLRHARRRRQWRRVRRAGGALAVLLLAGFVVWQSQPRRMAPTEMAQPQLAPRAYELVVSQPLTVGQQVSTQPLAIERFSPAQAAVAQVRTRLGGFCEVGDEELLTLAEPQIAALVRRGPHEAELVFVPPPNTAVQ
jgi:hypothetical protein